MAKKGTGDMNTPRQLGLRLDKALEAALEASAMRNERRLAEEARYAIRLYLGIEAKPVEDTAGAPV